MAINPIIKQKAADIRTKVFGSEVRESLASGLEGMSEDVESIKGRQGNVESQFQNVIDETTDKDVISAPEIIAARGGHNNLSQRLLSTDQQLAQNTNTNAILRTEKPEDVTFGEELINSASVTLGEGWAGNAANGFTHSGGYTDDLLINFPSLSEGTFYQIDVGINKSDMSDRNGTSDYYLSLGGTAHFETYQGVVTSQTWGLRSLGENNNLVITPEENFVGTLSLSVKEITQPSQAHTTFRDSDNNLISEYRGGKSGVNSIYLGRNAGQYSLQRSNESNVGIGTFALARNTGGFWNTALGHNALLNNTVGSRNIVAGYVAMQNNISGDRNIALGTFSLHRNTTGRNNIGIGADTLWYNKDGEGNIGIGLLANGDNVSGNYNTAIGYRAMLSADGGSDNVAIGRSTLSNVKTNNNIAIGANSLQRTHGGTGNIGIGRNTLNRMHLKSGNIAIGDNSMGVGETGDNNIAIGRDSLVNTTTSDNIAIGRLALEKNETGADNIAIGRQAFSRGDGASNSIAIGSLALAHATKNENVAIGRQASYELIDGTNNVAVGNNALQGSKNGNGNVAIGKQALATTNGNQNTAIGYLAGYENTGSNNVLIGYRSGRVGSGNGNIAIGYDVGFDSSTASNQLNIGNVIKGNLSPTSGRIEVRRLMITELPTSAGVTGELWNDNGTVKVS